MWSTLVVYLSQLHRLANLVCNALCAHAIGVGQNHNKLFTTPDLALPIRFVGGLRLFLVPHFQ